MKNWINRLLSTPEPQASTPEVAAPQPDAVTGDDAAIDTLYYRWLAGPAGFDAPPDTERLILEQVSTLAQNPALAAELVPRVPS